MMQIYKLYLHLTSLKYFSARKNSENSRNLKMRIEIVVKCNIFDFDSLLNISLIIGDFVIVTHLRLIVGCS